MGDNHTILYETLLGVFNVNIMEQLFPNSPKSVTKSVTNEESYVIDINEEEEDLSYLKKYAPLRKIIVKNHIEVQEHLQEHLQKLYTVHCIPFKYNHTKYVLKIEHPRYIIR